MEVSNEMYFLQGQVQDESRTPSLCFVPQNFYGVEIRGSG